MGKQIINILPEGSAVLNPDHAPFCLGPGSSTTTAVLPVYFNATVPAEIELLRIDLDTEEEEIIKIPSRVVNKVAKHIRDQPLEPGASGFRWQYPVKRPGVYRLRKVLDEYKLEVQRSTADTYVVPCPKARLQTADASERCVRDLSDLLLEVVGTPPLKVVYSRTINGKNHGFHFQSLQPDGFSSPLFQASSKTADDDFSWLRPAKVTVGLNESMTSSGEWEYSVDEVHDAFGNVVKYAKPGEDQDGQVSHSLLAQKFFVKERPKIRMQGCDLRNPLKVARGWHARLPVHLGLTGAVNNTSYQVTWEFSPLDSLTSSGDHGSMASIGNYRAKNSRDKPLITEAGLYTLKSVSSGSCEGDVDEPSSCLVLNPLEPQMSIRAEEIPDQCAGNSVGLRVDLDLVGTPPFTVRYDVVTDAGTENKALRVSGLRSQIELIPSTAGRHKYIFKSIDDEVYVNLPLTGNDKVLEQVVKPAASAKISNANRAISACLDSVIEVDVALSGDAPFNLEWEIVHDGKRTTNRVDDIKENYYKIKTSAFSKGGDYILALSSVQDSRGCRTFLQDQIKVTVRRQRPRAGFGLVEQKRHIMSVENAPQRLPLRLQGEAPWSVTYRNLNGSGELVTKTAKTANDNLMVRERGVYEITSVRDRQCSGTVDASASIFRIDWFPRPNISLAETNSLVSDEGVFVKQDVCEGDIDGFEVELQGESGLPLERRYKPEGYCTERRSLRRCQVLLLFLCSTK